MEYCKSRQATVTKEIEKIAYTVLLLYGRNSPMTVFTFTLESNFVNYLTLVAIGETTNPYTPEVERLNTFPEALNQGSS
ncbi:hypothetical protein CFP56_030557 [Quercus suber]|uniref:Uncharacterized protein n=1 Tax=Quercus suber TaxID=58331 RepID=A0AAW0JM93_QUESU